MRVLIPLAALAALLTSVGVASAVCPGREVLLEDTFDALKPTWGEAGDALKVDGGQLIVAPASGTYSFLASTSGLYDDLDMCVTVTTIKSVDPTAAVAGIIFWYDDANNFYSLQVAPNGKASVWRRQRGKWLAQVKWQDAGVNSGDGISNELRVTTVGGDATVYVNGARFATLAGSPPDKGQQVGLLAFSPEQGTASFAFDDFRVTKP
jgi:hypothetical protein